MYATCQKSRSNDCADRRVNEGSLKRRSGKKREARERIKWHPLLTRIKHSFGERGPRARATDPNRHVRMLLSLATGEKQTVRQSWPRLRRGCARVERFRAARPPRYAPPQLSSIHPYYLAVTAALLQCRCDRGL